MGVVIPTVGVVILAVNFDLIISSILTVDSGVC